MLLEILQVFTGIFVVVYDGQHALKYTLGRARLVVGPGIHFKWPVVQRFRVQDTKHTTLDLEPQVIQLQDDLVYDVGAKVVYQVVDLRKALIEVDDLVEGLKNRLTLAVQRVVKAQTRESIRDLPAMIAAVKEELKPVEEQWGIRIREFGFSNLSPTPPTLEITQLRLLAEEKLGLYHRFTRGEGLSEDAAVALISGAVMAVREGEREPRERPAPPPPSAPPEVGDAELAPVA
ncbi:MAG: SPFH domain-containing protein [Planctomycetes bacterium]|nr:SPFH domain-containing protein [Planctomycetota bacterium]